MLDCQEFAKRLRLCASGQSIEDLDEWFDENSWNVHQENNDALNDFVFRLEALFSAYAAGRLDAAPLRVELSNMADALRPFAERSYAENQCGIPYQDPTSGIELFEECSNTATAV